jgi:Flp pilus assembly pilin Flp
MSKMVQRMKQFVSDESGQGMVEYILIIGLIVLVIIVALFVFRDAIIGFINKVGGWLDQQTMPS